MAYTHVKEKGLCLESIQEFCEGIKRQLFTPCAGCDLHPQTSTPPHFLCFTSYGQPYFFYIRIAGKDGNGKHICGCNR